MVLYSSNNSTTDKDDNAINRKQKIKAISAINAIGNVLELTTQTN